MESEANPHLLILSSDHQIQDEIKFSNVIEFGKKYSQLNKLVTFGVVPRYPETGYGYIKSEKPFKLNSFEGIKISEFIEKLSNESGEVTTATIREENKEKQKTFDSDLGEAGEVLEKAPEEDIEAIENESEVIKFSTAVVADAIVAVLAKALSLETEFVVVILILPYFFLQLIGLIEELEKNQLFTIFVKILL